MQILIVAIGSTGDVHPFIALGQELAARGHNVTLFTSPAFQPLVERRGLAFEAVGTAQQYWQALDQPALWQAATSLATLWGSVAPTLRPLVEQLMSKIDAATIVIGSTWAFSARLVNEMCGVPLVTVRLSAAAFLSAQVPPVHKHLRIPMWLPYGTRAGVISLLERAVCDRVCAPALNRLRGELGLPPVSHILGRWTHSPHRVLGLFPEWFAPPQHDWPPGVVLSGFPLFDEPGEYGPDPELEDFLADGSPPGAPIVFAPGSTSVAGSAYMDTMAEALQRLGRRGVFLGRHTARMRNTRQRLYREFVPHSMILPRAAALVHHGGIGTMAAAFAAGTPQLVTPFAHDQFDNAVRLERLGCGMRRDWPADAAALAAALRSLLHSPAVRNACATIAQRMEPAQAARINAARVIEACWALHKPGAPLPVGVPGHCERAEFPRAQ